MFSSTLTHGGTDCCWSRSKYFSSRVKRPSQKKNLPFRANWSLSGGAQWILNGWGGALVGSAPVEVILSQTRTWKNATIYVNREDCILECTEINLHRLHCLTVSDDSLKTNSKSYHHIPAAVWVHLANLEPAKLDWLFTWAHHVQIGYSREHIHNYGW